MPARARIIASLTTRTASSWPTTLWWSVSSKWRSFSRSPVIIFVTGIPVQRLTTCAMSSSPTSSFNKWLSFSFESKSSCSANWRSNSGNFPYFNSEAFVKSYSRSAFSIWWRTSSSSFFKAWVRKIACFSLSQRALSSFSSATSSFFVSTILANRSLEASSVSLFKDCSSISSCMILWRISSRGAGMDSISVRSFAAASSTRSIALSGRKRSEI